MRLMSSLRTNKEIKERKKILEIFKIDIDNIILSMILYGCKRKGGILPTKKERIKEIKNEKENRKLHHCCGYRIY